MNKLKEKLLDYKQIANYRFEYLLENGQVVSFKLKQTDFPHLIGLHKLVDIQIIVSLNDVNNKMISSGFINSTIKREQLLTDSIIRKSKYFQLIEKRYNEFSKDALLSLSYTDVIVDFNPSLVPSKITSNYVFYEKHGNDYHHMAVHCDQNNQYIETFFVESSDKYLRNQTTIKVKKLTIYDQKGNVFLEDIF